MSVNSVNQQVERWSIYEISLKGPSCRNPFSDVSLKGVFNFGNRIIEAAGFYDGEDTYKIRFMPDIEGKWSFITESNIEELNGITGSFACTAPSPENHGPVKVVRNYHFAYSDGTPYLPFGTTSYSWNHRGEKNEKSTLEALKKSPFNKVRMLIYPQKHGSYNEDIVYLPFERLNETEWNFERPNPKFFQHLEWCITELMKLGIEADLIFFHPYDAYGFSNMPPEADDLYLKYTISRLAAYRNVWWSAANEFDLIKTKNMNDWDHYLSVISTNDPYYHLCSIHNSGPFYDHRKPWVTHLSIQCQSYDRWNRLTESIPEWRAAYRKPVVIDEVGYEGDNSRFWGSLTPQEFTRRIWHGTIMGGYVGHGETYTYEGNVVWTGQGIKLKGQSPERIGFLRKILEEAPVKGLEPMNIGKHIDCAGKEGTYYLAYLGINQPIKLDLVLPDKNQYKIDIIDTWEMTITPAEGTYSGKCVLKLPMKPYLAFRVYKA